MDRTKKYFALGVLMAIALFPLLRPKSTNETVTKKVTVAPSHEVTTSRRTDSVPAASPEPRPLTKLALKLERDDPNDPRFQGQAIVDEIQRRRLRRMERKVEADSEDQEARVALAHELIARGLYLRAEEQYRVLAEQSSAYDRSVRLIEKVLAETDPEQQRKLAQSLIPLRLAPSLWEGSMPTELGVMEAVHEGNLNSEAGNHAEALDDLNLALSHDPNSLPGLYYLTLAHLRADRGGDARVAADRLQQEHPGSSEAAAIKRFIDRKLPGPIQANEIDLALHPDPPPLDGTDLFADVQANLEELESNLSTLEEMSEELPEGLLPPLRERIKDRSLFPPRF